MKKLKKLNLIRLSDAKSFSQEELKRLKGGGCQAWLCQCNLPTLSAQSVDDTLESRDRDGYL
jgi:natural product precursor